MQLGVNTKPSPVANRRWTCNWGEYKTTPLELQVGGGVATRANTKKLQPSSCGDGGGIATVAQKTKRKHPSELRVSGRLATRATKKSLLVVVK